MSNSLWPHGLQPARLVCPPPSSGVCAHSCPFSRWSYLSHSLLPLSHFAFDFPSISFFFNESTPRIRWPKYWCFSFSTSPSKLGLVSFRIGWFDHLVIQGSLNHLLQNHNLKVSILWCSVAFMVQLSHPYGY